MAKTNSKKAIGLLGAGAGLLLLLTAGKASAKDKEGSLSGGDSSGGEDGFPVGPNGKCPVGYEKKQGLCFLPKDSNDKNNGKSGGSSKKLAKNALLISEDCTKYKFGDETGDAFWESLAPVAQQYVDENYTNSYDIAIHLLKQLKTSCFNTLLTLQDLELNEFEFYRILMLFRKEFPEMFILLSWLRDKIEFDLFAGDSMILVDDDCLVTGIGVSWAENTALPMLGAALDLEIKMPGISSEAASKVGDPEYGNKVHPVTIRENAMKAVLALNIPWCVNVLNTDSFNNKNADLLNELYNMIFDNYDSMMEVYEEGFFLGE